jgi:hypothetical protein
MALIGKVHLLHTPFFGSLAECSLCAFHPAAEQRTFRFIHYIILTPFLSGFTFAGSAQQTRPAATA